MVEVGGKRGAPLIRCNGCWPGPIRRQSGAELLEALYGDLQIAGNAYVEAAFVDGEGAARAAPAAPRPHAGDARRARLAGSL